MDVLSSDISTPLQRGNLFIHDQYLNAAIASVSTEMQCLLRSFKREDMRDELLQVKDSATQTLNRSWPGITVAVDESQVDLRKLAS